MNEEEFIIAVKELNINITPKELSQLKKYYQLLITWNDKINLTRITNLEDVYLKHFYDSLTITKAIDLANVKTLCDVGTGAGFPGIVLKIFFPHLSITLLDALNKRILFLNEVITTLQLTNIKAIHARGEDYSEKFDIVTTRAVASLDKLLPYCVNLLKRDGRLIAMKGNVTEEIINSKRALIKYHCHILQIAQFKLPKEESIRNILVIAQVKC